MISLVAIIGAYVASVFLGSRSDRIGSGVRFVLVLLAVLQVVIILAAMFLMEPPSMARGGS